MKKTTAIFAGMMLIVFILWRCTAPRSGTAEVQNLLPQDVLASCTVSADTFNTWFADGKASENGLVLPANSVTFPHRNNCDFYQWSEQMFLWLTSPIKGKLVLESPTFYGISPLDSAGKRTFIPHTAGAVLRMSGSIRKDGADRLPVMKDASGKLFEIEDDEPQAGKQLLMKSTAGGTVEVAQVKLTPQGTLQFLDRAGKTIAKPKPVIRHSGNVVHRFRVGNKSIFMDAQGNIIQSEVGQATGDALMTQNGSLVYYLSMANDVYAWYLTGGFNKANIDTAQFPTTAAQRDQVCAYARKNGAVLPDSNALAMELKSSWVEASSLSPDSLKNYITVQATIPTYNASDSIWIPKGEKTVTMALVGIHIVGSVAGHPEMIWATFEHENNTPNASFDYIDKNNVVKTVPQSTGTDWLFSSNAADTAYNVSHMTTSGDTIIAEPGHKISASNTLQAFPWGTAMGQVPNPENKTSAASNSEIISINNTIRAMLVGNDVRKNYILIGATWTSGGAAPDGTSYNKSQSAGSAIGTSVLANSTMETYFQADSKSCFTCHHGRPVPSLSPTALSHVFSKLGPLPDYKKIKQGK